MFYIKGKKLFKLENCYKQDLDSLQDLGYS